jgi:hypothetical protein
MRERYTVVEDGYPAFVGTREDAVKYIEAAKRRCAWVTEGNFLLIEGTFKPFRFRRGHVVIEREELA